MKNHEDLEVSAGPDLEADARREFLRKVGRASAAAPAVALLMTANLKPANAQSTYGSGPPPVGGCGCGGSA
jgi:hypothetical protein